MIAYFILVHRYPEQSKRRFRSIYDPANHYLDPQRQRTPAERVTAALAS